MSFFGGGSMRLPSHAGLADPDRNELLLIPGYSLAAKLRKNDTQVMASNPRRVSLLFG